MPLTPQSYPRVAARQFFATTYFVVGVACGFTSQRTHVTDVNWDVRRFFGDFHSSAASTNIRYAYRVSDLRPFCSQQPLSCVGLRAAFAATRPRMPRLTQPARKVRLAAADRVPIERPGKTLESAAGSGGIETLVA